MTGDHRACDCSPLFSIDTRRSILTISTLDLETVEGIEAERMLMLESRPSKLPNSSLLKRFPILG